MSSGADGDRYVTGDSIQWGDLVAVSSGAVLTSVVIAATDMFNFAVTGVSSFLGTVVQGLGGVLNAPFDSGEGAIATAWNSAGRALGALGIFAYPVSMFLVVVSIVLVVWGVNRLAN